MALLVIGLVLFFAAHTVSIVAGDWRVRMQARYGEPLWKAAYSVISVLGLILIIWGYGVARLDPLYLYVPPTWLRHVTLLLLLPVFPLLIATYLPGRIQAATRHPMLVAVKFWALAHLLANGTLADVLLFGSFLVWAVADRISLKHRPASATPQLPRSTANDIIVLVGGVALYIAMLFWLHPLLIGVSVI